MTKRICNIEDCGKPHVGLGYCKKHYHRFKAHGDPNYTKLRERDAGKNFLRDALMSDTDECIIWPYYLRDGYAVMRIDGKYWRLNRYVLTITSPRESYDGFVAAHAPVVCHNTACINKRHLRWATDKENSMDRFLDGTVPIGVDNKRSKLTEEDVLAIRSDKRYGTVIAKEYGISDSNVYAIKSRQIWKHL